MITTEKDKTMKKIMTEMNQDLYNGITLSQSMRKFKSFPSIIVSIVEAGEANGRLDTAFEQCALITKKDMALSGKLRSALMYPLFLIVLVIAVIIVLCCFVADICRRLQQLWCRPSGTHSRCYGFLRFLDWILVYSYIGYISYRSWIYFLKEKQCRICYEVRTVPT